MQLAKQVWDFSTAQGLLRPGDAVVVGVSGGPDSLCLLDVLYHLSRRHHLKLVVAHLNHGLRPEAEAEAAFVQVEAECRGLDFCAEAVDVQAAAQSRGVSLETAARQLRYDFLRRTAERLGLSQAAVAHTADDQAETVLMNMLRGTGLRGLRGMVPKRVIAELANGSWDAGAASRQLNSPNRPVPVFLIRPLLRTSRSDVLAYCAEHKLRPRFDLSNQDLKFTRNRVRHELLPILQSFNPRIGLTLAQMAEAATGDYEIWLEAVSALWQAAALPGDVPGQIGFDRQRWLTLSIAQQRALLRTAIGRLVGELTDVDFAPVEAAADFSRRARTGRTCQVVPGLTLTVETRQIRLVLGAPPAPADWPWMVGDALAPGWQLQVEPLSAGDWSAEQLASAPRWIAYVDADRLTGPLTLRARRAGDRFQPLGMKGHTMKLSDFLVNQKIPATQRGRWPLLTCGGEIIWVAGLRLDERYKVTDATKFVTRFSIRRAEMM